MVFTSTSYFFLLAVVFCLYWILPSKTLRNSMLLLVSYVFYGFVHPWLCGLLIGTTLVHYLAGNALVRFENRKRLILIAAIAYTLIQLGFFKYFDFFADNFIAAASLFGVKLQRWTLDILLPAGISFYSFQTIGYTVDVYRGDLSPRRNVLDFALFVSFFPQLVAGPIERAATLLPQIECKQRWDWERFLSAWPLLIAGFFKKLVIADNAAIYANKVFALNTPSRFLLLAGTISFALQIYADFSAYTDIARGSARLLGIELSPNFKAPYAAVSPSDFWRRWHISFSTWIRDYLYIPMGGSRTKSRWRAAVIVIVTFTLSGLWHGAAWNFVAWGLFHAALILLYRGIGFGRVLHPEGIKRGIAVSVMSSFTLLSWSLFRAPSLSWLYRAAISNTTTVAATRDALVVGSIIFLWTAVLSALLLLTGWIESPKRSKSMRAMIMALLLFLILVLAPDNRQDFIYFQF